MTETVEDIAVGLDRLIRARMPEARDVEITNVVRTSSGLSRENWPFDVAYSLAGHPRRSHRLVLRRDPTGSVLETDRRVEFEVLRALEHTDVLAPRAMWLDAEGEFLGRPSVVMERRDGVCDYFVLNGGVSQLAESQRLALAREFCELMAKIHKVDIRATGLTDVFPDAGDDGAGQAIGEWESYLHRQQLEAYPELEIVISWLLENKPRAQASVLVHGDFKPGNALVTGAHVSAMLDWETAHIGDPLEDVGWITNPLRSREHQIPGIWERDQIFRHYEKVTGFAVDEPSVHFWNVFANFKLAAITLTGVRTAIDGTGQRLYAAPTGLVKMLFRMIGA
jgi:aminoglycoside phosphotransferase (APT) family kinase protein